MTMNHRTESQLLQELSEVWSLLDMERRGRALAVAAERERCAKLCDEIGATMTAQAIREGA